MMQRAYNRLIGRGPGKLYSDGILVNCKTFETARKEKPGAEYNKIRTRGRPSLGQG